MNHIGALFCILFLLTSCEEVNGTSEMHHDDFQLRTVDPKILGSLESGKSYLSVYSQIYSLSEHKKRNLTVTATIRNVGLTDTLYITKAQYLDIYAKPIHTYFEKPVFVAPLETLEIVIDEVDQAGGIGANFIFDWKIKPNAKEPFFEGIMISTYGAQGLSFTTQGRRME